VKFIEMASPVIEDEEIEAVARVLKTGILTQGEKVAEFEESFRSLVGSDYACAVNSGTSALHVGLLASGLTNGDEVIVPSFTFAASANSIALTGATPIFIDVDINSYCLDDTKLESLITPRTRGVMPVHLYGNPANMTNIMKIASKHNIEVYEDAAQSHGAEHQGKPVGTFGKFAAFSFYPTKNITAVEAGMVMTSDESLLRKIKILRNQGMIERYVHELVGLNYRLSEVHAAIGVVQVKKLEKFNSIRKSLALTYDSELKNLITPFVPKGNRHVYHQYTIRMPGHDREKVVELLLNKGIKTGVYYPRPTHSQPAYGLDVDLPNTNILCREVLSLPIHPKLTTADQEYIVEELNKITSAGS
jgi:perosamine synthetase